MEVRVTRAFYPFFFFPLKYALRLEFIVELLLLACTRVFQVRLERLLQIKMYKQEQKKGTSWLILLHNTVHCVTHFFDSLVFLESFVL